MRSGLFFMAVFFLLAAPPQNAAGQDAQQKTSFKDRIPKDILNSRPRFLTFTLENDLFGSGRDENYTNGVRIGYFDTGTRPSFPVDLLDKYLPTFEANETTSMYYSIGQNLYTPEDITKPAPDPDDRPYAGFLYGSAGFTSITNNHIDEAEATVGIVGPAALGKPTQNFVHDLVNTRDPSGWDAQLDNEPALMVSWQRRWPEAYYADLAGLHFRTSPHIGATVGNVYTYAASGVSLQITPEQYKWQSQPLRVRPAIPGSGFFSVPDNQFAWSLFSGFEGRAVARNIFLDGNTFSDSPSVDKKHFVMDANAGLSLTYGRYQVSYTLNWRSKEFHGQDNSSLFGAMSFGYRF